MTRNQNQYHQGQSSANFLTGWFYLITLVCFVCCVFCTPSCGGQRTRFGVGSLHCVGCGHWTHDVRLGGQHLELLGQPQLIFQQSLAELRNPWYSQSDRSSRGPWWCVVQLKKSAGSCEDRLKPELICVLSLCQGTDCWQKSQISAEMPRPGRLHLSLPTIQDGKGDGVDMVLPGERVMNPTPSDTWAPTHMDMYY